MDENLRGIVFDIQRFCVSDGPGIRTCVFLKGCPLTCLWCHNPESQAARVELSLNAGKCIGCGECLTACDCHTQTAQGHEIDRKACTCCGRCAENCPAEALTMIGKRMSVKEVMDEVIKDYSFYQTSGGGVTISGGEPFYQAEFLFGILHAAHERGLHTCVETSGFAPWEMIRQAIPVTDCFLFDIKESDRERHRAYTGVYQDVILENLRRLDEAGAQIVLRCPVIPGYNDREEHFAFIGELAQSTEHVLRVEVEPYHPLGIAKAAYIGMENRMPEIRIPDDAAVAAWIASIAEHTVKTVKKA